MIEYQESEPTLCHYCNTFLSQKLSQIIQLDIKPEPVPLDQEEFRFRNKAHCPEHGYRLKLLYYRL